MAPIASNFRCFINDYHSLRFTYLLIQMNTTIPATQTRAMTATIAPAAAPLDVDMSVSVSDSKGNIQTETYNEIGTPF